MNSLPICSLCAEPSDRIIKDNTEIVNFIKIFFRTTRFDDTVKRSKVCLTCNGRLHQLYAFFVLAIEHRKHITEFSCFTCSSERLTLEYDVSGDVATFLHTSGFEKLFPRTACQLCVSCYCYIVSFNRLFKNLDNKLIATGALLSLRCF